MKIKEILVSTVKEWRVWGIVIGTILTLSSAGLPLALGISIWLVVLFSCSMY